MVKFVGLVLLGFVAYMAAAVPPTEDSNGHSRIRRTIWNRNPHSVPVGSVNVPHKDHYDNVQLNYDGSVERTHQTNPYNRNYNSQHSHHPEYNSGHNLGFNHGHSHPGHEHEHGHSHPGHEHEHGHSHPGHGRGLGHPNPVAEITRIGTDEYGHTVAKQTEIFDDGHTHESVTHVR